jgi:hypothetical protein
MLKAPLVCTNATDHSYPFCGCLFSCTLILLAECVRAHGSFACPDCQSLSRMLQVHLVFIMQLTYPALVVAAYFNVRC